MIREVFSQTKIRLVFGLLCGVALLSVGLLPQQGPHRLVGQAKFPWQQALSWQQIQMNDRLPAEEKAKATIDTFFVLMNECFRTWELLDFSFLFDLNDVKAWNDYAYERGRTYVHIEGNKVLDLKLTSYNYQPKYYSINISGSIADALMWPNVDWKWGTSRGFEAGGWAEHKFKLELINGQWKIKSLYCSESEQMYPRDTDFEKEAERVVRTLKRAKKELGAAALEDMKESDTPSPAPAWAGYSYCSPQEYPQRPFQGASALTSKPGRPIFLSAYRSREFFVRPGASRGRSRP